MNKSAIEELKKINDVKRLSNIEKAVENGAVIPLYDGVVIGDGVKLEKGVVVLTGTVLLGDTHVDEDTVIGPNSLLYNMKVGKRNHLNSVQGYESEIEDDCGIGPFVHIRPNSFVKSAVHLGNFVEVKNSTVGEETSVSHLTYIGDSDVGRNVNFGCGCVTVNFDGKNKHRTTVGDHCFIGCNTNLVAPVKVGDWAYTAAGSTITQDVPADALGIGRARQINKEKWVEKKKPYRGME